MIGNLCHPLFLNLGIVAAINGIQLVGAVMQASLAGGTHANLQTGIDTPENICVPAWCFAAVFQPIISMITWLHYFGVINLAIERDVDQDIVEMNIRLTFSDSHVPNWLLQQMICLERLDGRAFTISFGIIPSVELSRTLVSQVATACLFLGPYLYSVRNKLSVELACPSNY